MGGKYGILIPRFLGGDYGPDLQEGIEIPQALTGAMECVYLTRHNFLMSGQNLLDLRERFESHPDTQLVADWIERSGNTQSVAVYFWLCVAALNDWERMPRRTPTQHRELYDAIAMHAGELARLISSETESGASYVRGGGYGLGGPQVTELLTDSERRFLYENLQGSPASVEDHMGSIARCLPTMEYLIDRVGLAARRLSEQGPLHSQPNKRGAQRGFFVRRLAQLCDAKGPKATTEVLAALATVALNEPTDRELVAKLLQD